MTANLQRCKCLVFRRTAKLALENDAHGTTKVQPGGLGRIARGSGSVDSEAARCIPAAKQTAHRGTKSKAAALFLPENLDRLRIVDVSQTGETIPYPPFYERVRAGGARVVPDAAHMTAIPFIDVAVFNREPTLRTIFHTLVHVVQFSMVGLETVIKGYFKALDESGLWIVVPYEEQAYGLDGRFTKDPSAAFSVEAEVREWIRTGRF
jgi:hypothetical protein